jgi:phenylacetate-CoA ligase
MAAVRRDGGNAPWRNRLLWSAHVAWNAPTQPRFAFRSPAAIEREQRRRLRAAVAYAYRYVPYYRETMKRLGIGPDDFASASDLARLPIIERHQLQRDPEYFCSTREPLEQCVKLQSGGSTGEPVTVFKDVASVFANTLHGQRLRSLVARLAGKLVHFREVVITPPSSSAGTQAAAFRRESLVPPTLRAQRRVLSLLKPPSEHVAVLDEFRPDVLTSYGSYIEAFFVYIATNRPPRHLPKVVTYGGDSLSDSIRRVISEDFGIQVLSAYQGIETGQVGFECEEHRGYHVNVDFCPIRLVDGAGRDVPPQESGDVVISNLVNRPTVLLNYRLGDVARFLPGSCPCGRSLPMLSFLQGRTTEWMKSRSGKLVHPQSVRMLLRTEEDVWRYQVVQRSPDHFEVALVTAPGCDQGVLSTRMARRFCEQFGDGTTTETTFVDELPRTARGKVRPVISLAGGSPGDPGWHDAL